MNRQDALLTLKDTLQSRRHKISAALQGDLNAFQELSATHADTADAALNLLHSEVTSQLLQKESQELSQIDDAIRKLNQGVYGDCEGCGDPIPLARLEALPYATLCIKCQVKLEESGCSDWSELADQA